MQQRLGACLAFCQAEGEQQLAFFVRINLSQAVLRTGNIAESERHLRECVAAGDVGGPWGRAWCLIWLSQLLRFLGRWEEAEVYCHEALVVCRKHNFRSEQLRLLDLNAYLALRQDHGSEAEQLIQQALRMAEDQGYRGWVRYFRENLGNIKYRLGAPEEARRIFEQCLQEALHANSALNIALANYRLGFCWLALNTLERAHQHLRQALKVGLENRLELFRRGKKFLLVGPLVGAAILYAQKGDLERAVELIAMTTAYPIPDKYTDEEARLRTNLEAELPPDVFAAAWARGQASSLEDTVTSLLREWNTSRY